MGCEEINSKSLRKAGAYFESCDPEGFKRWSNDYGTRSLLKAGSYVYECDPESFERIMDESR